VYPELVKAVARQQLHVHGLFRENASKNVLMTIKK
jgi:hypothetical protein